MNGTEFRRDIQGLRAVAVLLIVFYHFGVSELSGGFLGVDIFFVISGYLITRNMMSESVKDNFSLLKFYGKRIRRLLPAFTVVATVTMTLSYFWFLPVDVEKTAQNYLSASLLVSNIFLKFSQFNYFSDEVTMFPLLHYWSLSVEEQFYLLWPLIFVFLYPLVFAKKHNTSVLVCGVALLFLIGVAQLTLYLDSGAAFYFVYARAFEFFFGISIVFLERTERLTLTMKHILSLVGIVLVAGSVYFLDAHSVFPGIYAIPVCLGTALLILCGHNKNVISRILGNPIFVFIGAISYSLYLWHWPPVAFAHYFNAPMGTGFIKYTLPVVTVFAILTYFFFEKLTRKLPVNIWVVGVLVLLPIVISSGFLYHSHKIASNLGSENFGQGLYRQQHSPWDCGERSLNPSDQAGCLIGDENASEMSFAFWGDSFADQYAVMYDDAAKKVNKKGALMIMQACPAGLGLYRTKLIHESKDAPENCIQYNEASISALAKHPSITTVFVAANFDWYEQGTLGDEPVINPEKSQYGIHEGFARAINTLLDAGKKVVYVLPTPVIYDYHFKIFDASRSGETPNVPRKQLTDIEDTFLANAKNAGLNEGVCFIRVSEQLCEGDICPLLDDQLRSIYADGSHFSEFGMDKILRHDCARLW